MPRRSSRVVTITITSEWFWPVNHTVTNSKCDGQLGTVVMMVGMVLCPCHTDRVVVCRFLTISSGGRSSWKPLNTPNGRVVIVQVIVSLRFNSNQFCVFFLVKFFFVFVRFVSCLHIFCSICYSVLFFYLCFQDSLCVLNFFLFNCLLYLLCLLVLCSSVAIACYVLPINR